MASWAFCRCCRRGWMRRWQFVGRLYIWSALSVSGSLFAPLRPLSLLFTSRRRIRGVCLRIFARCLFCRFPARPPWPESFPRFRSLRSFSLCPAGVLFVGFGGLLDLFGFFRCFLFRRLSCCRRLL